MSHLWVAGRRLYSPRITVTATTTLKTGTIGGHDWHGRPAVKRRPSDNALFLPFRSGTSHLSASSQLHLRFSDDDAASWTADDTTLGGAAVTGFPLEPSEGEINAGDGWPYVAPNGDLILHYWSVVGGDWPATLNGTWQARSADGESWTEEGQVDFGGGLTQDRVFATDQDVVLDGVTYACARVYDANTPTDSHVVFLKNETADLDYAAWEYVSDITSAGSDTQEIGFTYVQDRFVGWVRSLNNNITRKVTSADGLTWDVTDASHTPIGISGRHRVYTIAQLRGEANPTEDPRLLIGGFVNGVSGSSQTRTNVVWYSPDAGDALYGPFPLDTQSEDGGYGDLFGKADGTFGVVSYKGTLAAASLMQYDFTLTGT